MTYPSNLSPEDKAMLARFVATVEELTLVVQHMHEDMMDLKNRVAQLEETAKQSEPMRPIWYSPEG